jgi:HSP20 family molecular chaperone IbpA
MLRYLRRYYRPSSTLTPFLLQRQPESTALTLIESSVIHLNKTDHSEVFHEKTYALMKFEWDESEDWYKLLGQVFVDINPKQVSLSLASHQLIVETHMSPQSSNSTKPQSLCFRRHFVIPKNVDEAAISATLKDQLLEIFMPKISLKERDALDKTVDIHRV